MAYARTEGRGPTIVFLGGFRSDMTGTKAVALEAWANKSGRAFLRFDYLGHGQSSGRFEDGTIGRWLDDSLAVIDTLTTGKLVLVGSSMGGHVCTAGSRLLRAAGLFLMAPAFYMPGYEELTPVPPSCPISIVHGWRDDVVPVDNSIRFARQYNAALHVLDTDHRMQDRVSEIGNLFEYFLITLDKFGG